MSWRFYPRGHSKTPFVWSSRIFIFITVWAWGRGGGPGHTAGRTPARGSGSASRALVLQVLFEEVGGTSCRKCLLQIQDIVRRRQLLTVFREGKDGQQVMDVSILQALLKGESQAR